MQAYAQGLVKNPRFFEMSTVGRTCAQGRSTLSFACAVHALRFAHAVQVALLFQRWPPDAAAISGPTEAAADGRLLFAGPRVAMALHNTHALECAPLVPPAPLLRRYSKHSAPQLCWSGPCCATRNRAAAPLPELLYRMHACQELAACMAPCMHANVCMFARKKCHVRGFLGVTGSCCASPQDGAGLQGRCGRLGSRGDL